MAKGMVEVRHCLREASTSQLALSSRHQIVKLPCGATLKEAANFLRIACDYSKARPRLLNSYIYI